MTVDPKRSELMRRVRGTNTQPELRVRRLLFGLGYRYRLHRRDLPGSPDIVFPARRKVIFVHGCFWHRHHGCRYSTFPKTRKAFWTRKFDDNIARDQRNIDSLEQLGWKALVVWQCQTKDLATLEPDLRDFLDS